MRSPPARLKRARFWTTARSSAGVAFAHFGQHRLGDAARRGDRAGEMGDARPYVDLHICGLTIFVGTRRYNRPPRSPLQLLPHTHATYTTLPHTRHPTSMTRAWVFVQAGPSMTGQRLMTLIHNSSPAEDAHSQLGQTGLNTHTHTHTHTTSMTAKRSQNTLAPQRGCPQLSLANANEPIILVIFSFIVILQALTPNSCKSWGWPCRARGTRGQSSSRCAS